MTLYLFVFFAASALLLVIAPRLIGFRSQKPTDFSDVGPCFDPRTHLNGPILCEGVIYGPFGRVASG